MSRAKLNGICTIILLGLILIAFTVHALAPSAPTSVINSTLNLAEPKASSEISTAGGTITNLTISVTTTNPRWKGFVGKINGTLGLFDDSLSSLYSWAVESTTGEIYATRNSSVPYWSSIICASPLIIAKEELALNITSSNIDSINSTFNKTLHNEFYVGIEKINADSCPSIALNVNSTTQTTEFQQVLLSEGSSLIYASLLEDSAYGFNNQTYDFQMIVPEIGLDGSHASVPYYLYLELI
jgi:hypothetical protein